MNSLNIENANKLIEYSKIGLTKAQAGEKLGISDRQVLRILNKFNLKENYASNVKEYKDNYLYSKVIELYSKGYSLIMISKSINRSEYIVAEQLNKAINNNIIKPAICERIKCNNINNYEYSVGRFCSEKCSKIFATDNMTEAAKIKRRLTSISSEYNKKVWKNWHEALKNDPLAPNPKRQLTEEELKLIWTSERRDYYSKMAKDRINDGIQLAWGNQDFSNGSYPEQYWREVLTNRNIPFKEQVCITKKSLGVKNDNSWYKLDFLITIGKVLIDFEVDGKQHLTSAWMEHDKKRNKLLENNGYIVYRTPWYTPNGQSVRLENEIINFITFINKICEIERLPKYQINL